METLNFTQEQVTKILSDIAVGKEGISKVLKFFLEALMLGALPSPEATILLLGYVAMNKKAYQLKVPNKIKRLPESSLFIYAKPEINCLPNLQDMKIFLSISRFSQ